MKHFDCLFNTVVTSYLHLWHGMKKIKFNKSQPEYFHLNFDFNIHPLFPELDWLLMNYKLNQFATLFHIEVLCFVMMNTHSHLMFRAKLKNENYFTQALLQSLDVKDHPEFESNSSLVEPISSLAQFLNTYKYIYRNPVEAGLSKTCEDYRFSSLHALLGKSLLEVQIIDPLSVIQNPKTVLHWLNEPLELHYFKTSSTAARF